MKINIRIGEKIVSATVRDNEAERDFISLLPLSFSMNDLFRREKFGALPEPFRKSVP